jgi:hypothetical protein
VVVSILEYPAVTEYEKIGNDTTNMKAATLRIGVQELHMMEIDYVESFIRLI